MFKENFPSFENLGSSEDKEKQVFYEQQLDDLEILKEKEREVLSEKEKEINLEKNSEIKKKKINKLTAYVLTSLIALGNAQEGLQRRALAQGVPEKKIEQVLEKMDINKLEQQRLNDFRKMEKIFRENRIEEKINFLKEQYGQSLENFLSIHRITSTLEFFKMVKMGLEQKDPKVLVNKDWNVAMTPGSMISNQLKERWMVLSKEEKLEKSKDIKIKGFENLTGFYNESIKRQLQEIYPPQWLQASIKEIIYVPEIKKPPEKEGWHVEGETEKYGISAMLEKDIRAPIRIFDTPKGHTSKSILADLHHEIGHNNDWQSSQILSSQERINLLYDVAQRYNKPDRFKSEYVESIELEDKSLEAYCKTTEYWAEIVKEHMTDKKEFKKNHPKDDEVVEKWFNHINDIEI